MQAGFRVVSVSSASKRVAARASFKPNPSLPGRCDAVFVPRLAVSNRLLQTPQTHPNTTADFESVDRNAKPTDEALLELQPQIHHDLPVHECQHCEQKLDD